MGGILSTMIAIPLTPLEYSAIYSKGLVIYIPLYPSPGRVRTNKAATVANRQTVRGFQMSEESARIWIPLREMVILVSPGMVAKRRKRMSIVSKRMSMVVQRMSMVAQRILLANRARVRENCRRALANCSRW